MLIRKNYQDVEKVIRIIYANVTTFDPFAREKTRI